MQNKNGLAYLLLIFATLFWSGNFIVGKAASMFQIPPFSLNFYRWFFAGLILLPFTYKEIMNNRKYVLDNLQVLSLELGKLKNDIKKTIVNPTFKKYTAPLEKLYRSLTVIDETTMPYIKQSDQ